MSLPMKCMSAGHHLLEARLVGPVADAGDVVQQGVEPDLDRELLGSNGTRMPHVSPRRVMLTSCKPVFTSVDDLVAPALRLDEVGILLVEA